ncbi:uncharacterized protein B0I36DRAFT_82237 [Microdochium trichocladiopsis]|uniref:Uncharacterized protein n=1 Tax=Microdochium trichocladiopsis TaxID=1682393 RepID=A0A9P8YB12_9PEZI|nr:uncharacterized protein B0I36DRAFT_82237 [Microdochium trichocladiopsis]KAH7034580.1 hypothetical protein B0I36DRAFT_82237 [Microdochium trichocladiopsis]
MRGGPVTVNHRSTPPAVAVSVGPTRAAAPLLHASTTSQGPPSPPLYYSSAALPVPRTLLPDPFFCPLSLDIVLSSSHRPLPNPGKQTPPSFLDTAASHRPTSVTISSLTLSLDPSITDHIIHHGFSLRKLWDRVQHRKLLVLPSPGQARLDIFDIFTRSFALLLEAYAPQTLAQKLSKVKPLTLKVSRATQYYAQQQQSLLNDGREPAHHKTPLPVLLHTRPRPLSGPYRCPNGLFQYSEALTSHNHYLTTYFGTTF